MKLDLWVSITCVPNETTPCWPKVFASEAAADAHNEQILRGEWSINAPIDDETGKQLEYPGDWQTADKDLHEEINLGCSLEQWGRYDITSHQVYISPPVDPVAAARLASEALALARDCLKAAGATKALDKTRLALSSAKGAVRAAEYRQTRCGRKDRANG